MSGQAAEYVVGSLEAADVLDATLLEDLLPFLFRVDPAQDVRLVLPWRHDEVSLGPPPECHAAGDTHPEHLMVTGEADTTRLVGKVGPRLVPWSIETIGPHEGDLVGTFYRLGL